jgi:hypothetical protein
VTVKKNRCEGRNRFGGRCKKAALRGRRYCDSHDPELIPQDMGEVRRARTDLEDWMATLREKTGIRDIERVRETDPDRFEELERQVSERAIKDKPVDPLSREEQIRRTDEWRQRVGLPRNQAGLGFPKIVFQDKYMSHEAKAAEKRAYVESGEPVEFREVDDYHYRSWQASKARSGRFIRFW